MKTNKKSSKYKLLWPVGGVFTYGPGNPGSIPARVIPKTQKMVCDASLLSIKHIYQPLRSGRI